MDALLGKVTAQAMNYAIRSGITITATYAIRQGGRLLQEVPRGRSREELEQLQLRLEGKIRIISPAIDMIELISARGNTSLENAASLTKEIRFDIQKLGVRLSEAANEEELVQRKSSRAKTREQMEAELSAIIREIKKLLVKIEDAVPLINLAITTSGVNLSTKLSGTISPSRLMQASTFLTGADSKYASQSAAREQVGPTYILSMYMLFAGHAWRPEDEGVREMTWKEVIHKARVKLFRIPLDELYDLPGEQSSPNGQGDDSMRGDASIAEFAYQLVIVEDLDDDRAHTFEENEAQPGPFDDVENAGIRDIVPVHEISKVFYADTGKILNIRGESDTHDPVLLLRRDVHAEPPRRMMHQSQMDSSSPHSGANGANDEGDEPEQSEIDAQIHRESTPAPSAEEESSNPYAWRLPPDLDPEWMAFEVYTEEPDSASDVDAEEDTPSTQPSTSRAESTEARNSLSGAFSKLTLRTASTPNPSPRSTLASQQVFQASPPKQTLPPQIKTTLSLLEMLLKLAALQQFRQESHLAIEDELLNFFLEDSATAGAGPDREYRQRLRHDAVRRVGFDPYDESPIKRRSESYIRETHPSASPGNSPSAYNNYHYNYTPAPPSSSPHAPDNTPSRPPPALSDHPHPSIEPSHTTNQHHTHPRRPNPHKTKTSTPPPRPPYLGQPSPTPPRPSTLRTATSPATSAASEAHRQEIAAKYSAGAGTGKGSPGSPATPPSSAARSRQALLRAQSEGRGSPLGRVVEGEGG